MKPKAEILPRMRVSTGSAKRKKVRAETRDAAGAASSAAVAVAAVAGGATGRGSRPSPRVGTSFERAERISAAVETNCAAAVAIAAPRRPHRNLATSRKSPATLTTVE